jgi:hypothetical protein
MDSRLVGRSGLIAMLTAFAVLFAYAQRTASDSRPEAPPGENPSIPQAQLIQPEALDKLLKGARADKPLILQVGSHVLYADAHIPGAQYTGPAGLQGRVESLPRAKLIVLYCGCCTWNRCCNVSPAFTKLRSMGFTNVRVLYLADNFGISWVNKGYRAEQGR